MKRHKRGLQNYLPRRQSYVRTEGSILIELACGASLMLVFSLLCADIGMVVFGVDINDRACRDAARAAALGGSTSESVALASAALKAHAADGYYFTSPQLVLPISYNDYGGNPPAQTSPYVQITTSTIARVPFAPVDFFGAQFLKNGTISFKQTYTFPLLKAK